jgi:hypothetical protein
MGFEEYWQHEQQVRYHRRIEDELPQASACRAPAM